MFSKLQANEESIELYTTSIRDTIPIYLYTPKLFCVSLQFLRLVFFEDADFVGWRCVIELTFSDVSKLCCCHFLALRFFDKPGNRPTNEHNVSEHFHSRILYSCNKLEVYWIYLNVLHQIKKHGILSGELCAEWNRTYGGVDVRSWALYNSTDGAPTGPPCNFYRSYSHIP